MLEDLKKPEYLHVLLNPLPIYGLAIAAFALAVGLLQKNRAAQVLGLWLVFVCAASAWPTYGYGEDAYHRIYLLADGDGQTWLDRHMHRAEKWIYAYYAAAAVSLAAIFLPVKFPRVGFPLAALALALTAASLGAGGWIAHAGGKIRHSEFRKETGPEPGNGTNDSSHAEGQSNSKY